MNTYKYINDNFLLKSDLAVSLFHSVAKYLPAVDYHNHLNPNDLAINRKFRNIADGWVLFDPYKHRAMRICGIPENGITGNAPEKEKFLNWAVTVPKTIGNPMFVWSALELKRVFGIDEFLSGKNATEIWDFCNTQLQQEGFGAVELLKKFKVETLCTSDDFLDDLTDHLKATNDQQINVLPSLRGDLAVNIEQPTFINWLENLKNQTAQKITNLEDYKLALVICLNKFLAAGCKLADHSLDGDFKFVILSEKEAEEVFKKVLNGAYLSEDDTARFKNYILHFLGTEYAHRGWILQLHIGAQRFTSSRLRKLTGPTGGYATMGNSSDIAGLCSFIDELEKNNTLPKIILYTLNPADNEAFATITGSYSEDGVPGKIQFGPGWWYNDQYEGIRRHLRDITHYGLLSRFIGMTTDSRSVFSFSRHEYFRRILCNQVAEWAENGIMPNDFEMLSNLVGDISYHNSKKYIKL